MTKAYVTEYARQSVDNHGNSIAAGEEPPLTEYVIDYNAGEAHGANLNAKTRLVRVHVDSIASIKIDAAAVAATTNKRLAAGQTEYFGVVPEMVAASAGVRVSAITNT